MRSIHVPARRIGLVLALVVGTLIAGGGVSSADPAPPPPSPAPPNPSDQQLDQSKNDMSSAAAQVGMLTNQLAAAQAKADELGGKLEIRQEAANKALVDLQTAQDAAEAAAARVQATHAETEAATAAIEQAHARLDQFIAVVYEQGVDTGSLGLLAQAVTPDDVVERAELRESVAREQQDAMDSMRRAQIAKVNADSLARAARDEARAKRATAVGAKLTADGAVSTARAAVAAGMAQMRQVDQQRADIEHQLDVLTAKDSTLRAQRQQYLDYQAQVAAAARAAQAAAVAKATGAAAGGGVQTVISRALSQIGVTYAWGGGNGGGPTKGIRDGGVADDFRDYTKTGFDCSGLMIYAFKAAGIGLPHYSGYQYNKGRKVPIAQMQPGDMLFWADGGTIHHVALYIGDGKMVEAPYSGAKVKISPVRYQGLMPYATRVL